MPSPTDTLILWINPISIGGLRHFDMSVIFTHSVGSEPLGHRPVAEILAANDLLYDRVDRFSGDVWRWASLDPAQKAAHIDGIKEAGRAFAEAFFGDELPKFTAILRQHNPRRLGLHMSDDTFSPCLDFLRLIYDRKECFLGELVTITPGHVGKTKLKNNSEYDEIDSPSPEGLADEFSITRCEDPPIGLAEDSTLRSACVDRKSSARSSIEEIYTLQPLVLDLDDIDVLRELDDAAPRPIELTDMNEWMYREKRLLHFNCHGISASRGRHSDPKLQVTEKFSFDKNEMDDRDLSFALVNLNVCDSAVGTYSNRKTLAQAFHDHYAAAVVCTTFSVDDGFATEFAREFYQQLANTDLLTAVHHARRELLKRHDHPMSLTYTFTGDSTLRLDNV